MLEFNYPGATLTSEMILDMFPVGTKVEFIGCHETASCLVCEHKGKSPVGLYATVRGVVGNQLGSDENPIHARYIYLEFEDGSCSPWCPFEIRRVKDVCEFR